MPDTIPLWFGEGVWPTHAKIVNTAVQGLQSGLHHYQPNNGMMSLREEICRYSNSHYRTSLTPARVTVTPSGMQGLMLSAELLISPGDSVVTIEPSWPNIAGSFRAMGANIKPVPLRVSSGKWEIDVDELVDALTEDTKVLVVNSPNNPTGWTMSAPKQRYILAHCRDLGIWIVADDVYSRLYRHASQAPSFLSIARPEDRVISVNSFSKSWSMTGWRLGWIVAPAACETRLGQLTEFNTCCTPGFIQQAGVTALRECEHEIDTLRERIRVGYDVTAEALKSYSRVQFVEPDGAFYVFFRVEGMSDSLATANEILQETKVGLAPGAAFGWHGEGYLRLCYAKSRTTLDTAFGRLEAFLK